MKYIKETDNKGRTYIIEGNEKSKGVFSIERFICEVQVQETDKGDARDCRFIINCFKQRKMKSNKTKTGLTSKNGMIDACNHVTLDEGEKWDVSWKEYSETEIYVIGYGFYQKKSFVEFD